jgi:hypothetical protein
MNNKKYDNNSTENLRKQYDTKTNIVSVLLSGLVLATALGFNDLTISLFNTLNWNNHLPIAKGIYFSIMFIFTISIAYYMNKNIINN